MSGLGARVWLCVLCRVSHDRLVLSARGIGVGCTAGIVLPDGTSGSEVSPPANAGVDGKIEVKVPSRSFLLLAFLSRDRCSLRLIKYSSSRVGSVCHWLSVGKCAVRRERCSTVEFVLHIRLPA